MRQSGEGSQIQNLKTQNNQGEQSHRVRLLTSGELLSMSLGEVPSDADLIDAVRVALNIHEGHPDNDRIIRLSVGGSQMTVLRDTLCLVEGSLLEGMFSGRGENLYRDRSGSVFIDQPIELFKPLIDFLRGKAYENASLGPTAPPKLDEFASPRQYLQFLRLVDYYGLTRYMFPVQCVNLETDVGFTVEEAAEKLRCSSPRKRVRTYILPYEHERAIQSFDIRILSQGDDNFRFGWTESADGVVVFDAARGMIYDIPAHAHRNTRAPVETTAAVVKLKPGTIITCKNANWNYRWLVNGEVVGSSPAKLDYKYPCVAGQGKWSIENIKYSF